MYVELALKTDKHIGQIHQTWLFEYDEKIKAENIIATISNWIENIPKQSIFKAIILLIQFPFYSGDNNKKLAIA